MVRNVPATRQLVRLNLDESFITLDPGPRKGVLFRDKISLSSGMRKHRRPQIRSQKRKGFTFVAMICDNVEVQELLPQVLLGGPACFLAREVVALQALVGPNIFIIRSASGWNNSKRMVGIIELLATCTRDYYRTHQFCILPDAGKCHITEEAARCLQKHRIWFTLIPARMTFLLQPLDTHVFALLKRKLRDRLYSIRIIQARSTLTILEFMREFDVVLQELFSTRSWAHAFDGDGYGRANNPQECVRDFIRDSLEIASSILIAPGEPSRVELWMVYPRNSHPPWHYMLPTRQSMVGLALGDIARPEMLPLEVAPLIPLADVVEPLRRRRRILPATFV